MLLLETFLLATGPFRVLDLLVDQRKQILQMNQFQTLKRATMKTLRLTLTAILLSLSIIAMASEQKIKKEEIVKVSLEQAIQDPDLVQQMNVQLDDDFLEGDRPRLTPPLTHSWDDTNTLLHLYLGQDVVGLE